VYIDLREATIACVAFVCNDVSKKCFECRAVSLRQLLIFNISLDSQLTAVTCKLVLTESLNVQMVRVVLRRWYRMPWQH